MYKIFGGNMEKSYFASCNSYDGFKSYFGEIFSSNEFDRIFVLKGGPGTGKSTLMKKLSKHFENHAVIENFYCSSDANSLDAVIIEKDEKKVAIIDGTAPHERDAVIVGAVDEIVNLGENLNNTWLLGQRDKILDLSAEKSNAYKTGYSYLRCAGACYKESFSSFLTYFDFNSAYKYIVNLDINDNSIDNINNKIRLISSFSKDGYLRKNKLSNEINKAIFIGGNSYNCKILMNLINSQMPLHKVVFPHPLTPEIPEAIYYENNNILILATEENAFDLDADTFSKCSRIQKEELRVLNQTHKEFLMEAQRWFSIASDIHFRLEDIYSKCMSFQGNDEIFEKICEKISKLCDIKT